jgi:hypothetical protein
MTEDKLRGRFGDKAVDALVAQLRSGEAPEIDPLLFAAKLAGAGIVVEVKSLLDAASEAGLVARVSIWRCPEPSCRRLIDSDAVANRHCPYCGTDYRETGDSSMAISRRPATTPLRLSYTAAQWQSAAAFPG